MCAQQAVSVLRSENSVDSDEISIDGAHSGKCGICKNHKSFKLSKALLEEFRAGNVVVFAGAGISTESRDVIGYTFFQEICSLAKLDSKKATFPGAMGDFCKRPNGRLALVSKIKERLDYVDSFPELQRTATRFHRELATVPFFNTIVTTNWDTYFERFCGAQPFVAPHDFAFWNATDRKVLKIHGSITEFGSLVATTDDYSVNSEALSNGMLGSFLKTLISTRTIVFFGYSARDEDFNQLWGFVRTSLGVFGRQHYIVTIEDNPEEINRFRELSISPICTDATYFLHAVKAQLSDDERYIRDEIYDKANGFLGSVRRQNERLHKRFNIFDDPEIIMCASYQDGMRHALERIVNLRVRGTYSIREYVHNLVHGYALWRKEKAKAHKFADVAYIDGYMNVMLYLLEYGGPNELSAPPEYYLFSKVPSLHFSLEEFSIALKRARRKGLHHKGAYKESVAATKKLDRKADRGMIIQHKCQLL